MQCFSVEKISLKARYFPHLLVIIYISTSLLLVSFFLFFLPYTVEHFILILIITGKNCYSFELKMFINDNSFTRLREEMITRQPGNWGLSSGNTINMVKSKLSLTYKTHVQSMCRILILLYYLLVAYTCIVAMVLKHINTMLCASLQVYSLCSKRFHAVSGKEWGTRVKDCLKMGRVKKWGGSGKESFPPLPLPLFPFFGSHSIFRTAKMENPVPRHSSVILCSEPHGNAF